MRILLTNNTLDHRAGSELYVRDVALALIRRGHEPIAYSTRLGEVARELRAATVPVIDDLERLARAPDVIHGQHHLDAMTAMLRFPEVPAIYYCHGFLPWQEMPVHFPSIVKYVAVDDLCRERLESEHGIAPERIRTIRNFVDLEKFERRGSLPSSPTRALVFSNYAREDGYVGTVRRACESLGIALDVIGLGVGRSEAHPERLLAGYPLVFAKARAAIEALATGAAVVTCDANGLAGMVTPENFDALRRLNFGARSLNRPITEESIRAEILRYDAAASHAVTDRVRAEAGLEDAVDRIVELYEEVVAHARSSEPREKFEAASRYLATVGDFAKGSVAEALELHLSRADAAAQRDRATKAEARAAGLEARAAELDARRLSLEAKLAESEAALHERNQPWSLTLGARRMRKVLVKEPIAAIRERVRRRARD